MEAIHKRSGFGKIAIVLVTVALTVAGVQASASADETGAEAALVERITDGAVLAGEPMAADNSDVTIPSSGGSDVSVAGEGGTATLSIPASGSGVTADNGTTVFEGTSDDSAIAVQTTDSGVRAVVDIQSAVAPESYDFELGGDIADLALNEDGSVTVTDEEGNVTGQVAAPWAYDANGKSVPSHYEVNGVTLTQFVEHKGGDFAYGIVADPRLTYGWGVYLNLTGTEMKAIAAFTYTTGAVASIIACEFKNIPYVGSVVRVLCIVVGGASVLSILKTLSSIAKSKSVTSSGCYQTKIIPMNREFKKVDKDNCTG